MTKRSRSELVDALQELVELLTLAEGGRSSFRARAFACAAQAVEDHAGTSTMTSRQLKELSGIGKSTAETISEFYRTDWKTYQIENSRDHVEWVYTNRDLPALADTTATSQSRAFAPLVRLLRGRSQRRIYALRGRAIARWVPIRSRTSHFTP